LPIDVIYIASSLSGVGGHPYRIFQEVLPLCRESGISVRTLAVICHRATQPNAFDVGQVFAVLPYMSYESRKFSGGRLITRLPLGKVLLHLAHERRRYHDYKVAIASAMTLTPAAQRPPDVSGPLIIFEGFAYGEWLLARKIVSSIPGGKAIFLQLVSPMAYHRFRGAEWQLATALYKKIIGDFVAKKNLVVLDNDELAADFGMAAQALQYPYGAMFASVECPKLQVKRKSNAPPCGTIRFLLPGLFRGNKRFELGIAVVEELAHRITQRCEVRMQQTGNPALDEHPMVRVLPNRLSDTQYVTELNQATFVWCAFGPEYYCLSGASSGVLRDCLVFGVPAFVTEGTWMARMLNRFGLNDLIVPAADSTEPLVTRIQFAVANLASIEEKCKEAALAYRSQLAANRNILTKQLATLA